MLRGVAAGIEELVEEDGVFFEPAVFFNSDGEDFEEGAEFFVPVVEQLCLLGLRVGFSGKFVGNIVGEEGREGLFGGNMGKVSVLTQFVFFEARPFFGCGACGKTADWGGMPWMRTRALYVGGVDAFFDIGHCYNNSLRIPADPGLAQTWLLPFFGSYVAIGKFFYLSLLGAGLEPARPKGQGILSP